MPDRSRYGQGFPTSCERARETLLRVQAQVRQPQLPQPGPGSFLAFQHCDRRGRASDQAMARHDTHAGESLHGPVSLRIQDVAVANAVDHDTALVVSAARNAAPTEINRRHGAGRVSRVSNADAPRARGSIGPLRVQRAHDTEVSTQVDESRTDAAFATQLCNTVRRILLHETAKVELHTHQRQDESWRPPVNLLPADAHTEPVELGLARDPIGFEIPNPTQDF